jgi:addiction module HigA family antidote
MKENSDLIPLTHPGEHLKEIMEDWEMTQYRLAKELGVQQTRIAEIVNGRRAITADTALRLAQFYGTSPELWLNLQSNYDLAMAKRKLGQSLQESITPVSGYKRKTVQTHS